LDAGIIIDAVSCAVGGSLGDNDVAFDGALAEGFFCGGGGGDEDVCGGGGLAVLKEAGGGEEGAIEEEERWRSVGL
jgi:hypothetical protein